MARMPMKMTAPALPPHRCMGCMSGAGQREFFFDTGVDTEWDGTVYLCDDCFANVAKLDGRFMSVERHNELLQLWMDNDANLRKALRSYEELESALSDLGIDAIQIVRFWKDGKSNVRAETGDGSNEPEPETSQLDLGIDSNSPAFSGIPNFTL